MCRVFCDTLSAGPTPRRQTTLRHARIAGVAPWGGGDQNLHCRAFCGLPVARCEAQHPISRSLPLPFMAVCNKARAPPWGSCRGGGGMDADRAPAATLGGGRPLEGWGRSNLYCPQERASLEGMDARPKSPLRGLGATSSNSRSLPLPLWQSASYPRAAACFWPLLAGRSPLCLFQNKPGCLQA